MSKINISPHTEHGHKVRQPAANALRHAPTQSHILMRTSVKKPGPSLKRQIKAHGQLTTAAPLTQAGRAADHQFTKARRVPQSQFISHFSASQPTAYSPPSVLPEAPAAPKAGANINGILPNRPVASFTPAKTTSPTDALLQKALSQADSHTQKPLKKSRSHFKRQVSILAVVALAVGVITVIANQNLSGAQLQVASAKAGFSAKLPDYTPAGFSQSGLDSSPGVVATQFHSNSDDRSYTITQKTSKWSNDDLLSNFVESTDPNYTAMTNGTITVYIYGNHNATWVKNGVWYNVQNNGVLSDHQLGELAASL